MHLSELTAYYWSDISGADSEAEKVSIGGSSTLRDHGLIH